VNAGNFTFVKSQLRIAIKVNVATSLPGIESWPSCGWDIMGGVATVP